MNHLTVERARHAQTKGLGSGIIRTGVRCKVIVDVQAAATMSSVLYGEKDGLTNPDNASQPYCREPAFAEGTTG